MNFDADTLRILGIIKDSFFPLLIAGLKFTIPVAVGFFHTWFNFGYGNGSCSYIKI